MSLTKEEFIEKVEVVGLWKTIQVKQVDVIKEDGVEISKNTKRYILQPDADLSNQPTDVTIIADAVWTPAFKQRYVDHLIALAE